VDHHKPIGIDEQISPLGEFQMNDGGSGDGFVSMDDLAGLMGACNVRDQETNDTRVAAMNMLSGN
jgi:hypothetical protein